MHAVMGGVHQAPVTTPAADPATGHGSLAWQASGIVRCMGATQPPMAGSVWPPPHVTDRGQAGSS